MHAMPAFVDMGTLAIVAILLLTIPITMTIPTNTTLTITIAIATTSAIMIVIIATTLSKSISNGTEIVDSRSRRSDEKTGAATVRRGATEGVSEQVVSWRSGCQQKRVCNCRGLNN